MRLRICALATCVITLAGCAKNGTTASADSATPTTRSAATTAPMDSVDARHAIDSINTKFSDALTRNDAKTLGAMYASDAITDWPGAPILTGGDAITKALEQNFAQQTIRNPRIQADGIIASGDLAVENGTWSWTAQPKKGGKAEAQQGHYLTVWRHRSDGTWKILRDYVTADPAEK